MRLADAGYEIAVAVAREKGLDLPGVLGVKANVDAQNQTT